MSRIIAVIPARGQSKGIPSKNLRLLGGKSLLAHTIEDALVITQEVYVSTDDDDIVIESVVSGATPIHRPSNISGNEARSEWAVSHVLSEINADENDIVIFLQCTSPFRHPSDLSHALMQYRTDTMFSAYELHPYIWDDNVQRLIYPEQVRIMRQNKRNVLVEDGSFYIGRVHHYTTYSDRLYGKTEAYIHPEYYGIQIDSMEDLEWAQHTYSWLIESGKL